MTQKSIFNFKRQVLYPSCLLFFVLLMSIFLIALAMGINVTESTLIRDYVYNGGTNNSSTNDVGKPPAALGLDTLLGLMFYAFSFVLLMRVFVLDVSVYAKLCIHFLGTLFSYLLFFIILSGTVSSENAALVLGGATLLYVFAYFLVLLIVRLLKKFLLSKVPNQVFLFFNKHILPVFCGFTVIFFLTTIFSLISKVEVITSLTIEKTFTFDDVYEEVTRIIATPLAPTIQNYLRYLTSSAAYFLGLNVLYAKFNVVLKVCVNFIILSTSFFVIWLLGSDYFRFVKSHAFIAVTVFLIVYVAGMIVGGTWVFVKKRQKERTDEYDSQFSASRKKTKS